MNINFNYPAKLHPLVSQPARYKVARGGRGSGKSWTIAKHLLIEAAFTKQRVLCTREMQTSIKDSVHLLLKDQIWSMGLKPYYNIQKDGIYSRAGSEFIFKGLRHNIGEIKSTEGVTRCWIEEAEKVSKDSLKTLTPTIRMPKSEIFFSYNPEDPNSAMNKMFPSIEKSPPETIIVDINFWENLYFPEVLRKDMEYCKKVDYEAYEHIWCGKFKKYAHALILKGKFRQEDFVTPEYTQLFFGSDFGFSEDPTCLIRMFIQGTRLYIDYEAYGHGVEINELEQFFNSVPGSDKWKITADSARPETISHLSQLGFNIVGAEKGKGSVEDGIQFLRSFEEVVVHTRCPKTYEDLNNWKWKVDRINGEILPIPAEGHDHAPDAIRYALESWMQKKVTIFD